MASMFGFSAWFCLIENSFTLILVNPIQPCAHVGILGQIFSSSPSASLASIFSSLYPSLFVITSPLNYLFFPEVLPSVPLCSCAPRTLYSAHFLIIIIGYMSGSCLGTKPVIYFSCSMRHCHDGRNRCSINDVFANECLLCPLESDFRHVGNTPARPLSLGTRC